MSQVTVSNVQVSYVNSSISCLLSTGETLTVTITSTPPVSANPEDVARSTTRITNISNALLLTLESKLSSLPEWSLLTNA